ncbi:MAG: MmcQ/YjbR family DNA-binding protein [Ignavibacteriales bacterium]|nr:MmcQ/YjbR family DNA-binding protein [Ignavibacteriales bacterium]
MILEKIREYCLKKKGVTEDFPFDETTLVFRVGGKIFLLTDIEPPFSINLKCDPEKAIELRERYEGVTPGYHMNKKNWNTIDLQSNIPIKEIYKWIDHSYELVLSGLSKAERSKLVKKF